MVNASTVNPSATNSLANNPPATDTNFLIDSHCHLHDKECFPDTTGENSPGEILKDARTHGVRQYIVIGTSHPDSLAAAQFARTHEDVFYAYGIHPSEASERRQIGAAPVTTERRSELQREVNFSLSEQGGTEDRRSTGGRDHCPQNEHSRKASRSNKLVAIGEVGLDYHYKPYDKTAQIKLFEEMINLAQENNLPLVFHIREAFDDFFPIVDNQHVQNAVVHSFSDSKQNLEKALSHGYYIGVNGLATFADLPLPPLDRILLETDAPYLTPKPFRGKINKSGYIKLIADYLCEELKVPFEEVERRTTQNVQTLFHLPDPVLRAE